MGKKVYYILIISFILFTGCNRNYKSLKIEDKKEAPIASKKFLPQFSEPRGGCSNPVFSINRIGIPPGMYTNLFIKIKSQQNEKSAQTNYIEMTKPINLLDQLYGLYGLKIIFSKKYEDQKKLVLLNANKEVLYGGGGCIVNLITVMEAVEIIDKYEPINESLQ